MPLIQSAGCHLGLALYPSGWASTLCLRFLFAPCSCRRAYWRSSLRPRVFESSGLSPGFFPFRGQAPVSRLFLSLRPRRSRSPIPSLAPSWWSPCPLMRWALLTLSCHVLSVPSVFSLLQSRLSIPFAMSPLSLTVSVLCERSFLRGTSPHALGSVGAHGVRGGSTYIALHRSWSVSAILTSATWSSGRCFLLFLRDVPHVFMALNLSVYLTYPCPSLINPVGLYYWTLDVTSDWVDLGSPSSHFQDSVDCADLWSQQPAPEASSNRHSVAVALSSSL